MGARSVYAFCGRHQIELHRSANLHLANVKRQIDTSGRFLCVHTTVLLLLFVVVCCLLAAQHQNTRT